MTFVDDTPEVGAPITPVVPVKELGVPRPDLGGYTAWVFDRGRNKALGPLFHSALTWDRVQDETSHATVTCTGDRLDRCEKVALEAEAWRHEIGIFRNGQLVWAGPIVDVKAPGDSVVFECSDISAWFGERTPRESKTFDNVDGALILWWLAEQAMAWDNSFRMVPLVEHSGIRLDREVIHGQHRYISTEIAEVAQSSADWYVIDRNLYVGNWSKTPPVCVLRDQHWKEAPATWKRGFVGNHWIVLGGAPGKDGASEVGEYTNDEMPEPFIDVPQAGDGDEGFITPEASKTFSSDIYGVHVKVHTDSDITNQKAAIAAARERGRTTLKPQLIFEGGALDQSAPVNVNGLLPGHLIRVLLSDTRWPIVGNYVITKVMGTDDGESSADVSLECEPVIKLVDE